MHIRDHRLHPDAAASGPTPRYAESPNHDAGFEPRYLIVHYTAMPEMDAVIALFQRVESQVSAHLVIGRDGAVVQMVPFDRRAWHAGKSRWGGLDGLNRQAIGLELVNAGKLTRDPAGTWRCWSGAAVPAADVTVATHPHEDAPAGWHSYPPAQLHAAIAVARLLCAAYPITTILGHDDVSPGRKIDPGPAFPMAAYRAAVLGA